MVRVFSTPLCATEVPLSGQLPCRALSGDIEIFAVVVKDSTGRQSEQASRMLQVPDEGDSSDWRCQIASTIHADPCLQMAQTFA